MQFDSYTFLIFFAAVLAVQRSPISWSAKKLTLLVASYLFYAAWNPPFVLLLWLSTLVDWFVARAIDRSETPRRRRGLVGLSLAVNLGVLGFFKYGGFALENFAALVRALGIAFEPAAPSLVLPVGISFYTFQTLSYTLDVYRREARPASSFVDYALYVTFFPQLVAGPIVRSGIFLPQCRGERRADRDALGRGLAQLVLGLFMKVVVADGLLAPVVEQVFDGPAEPAFGAAWIGSFAFAGQIFCDFAGYSTCAIGVAACLGFEIPANFRFPYAAAGFSDFWRRWHISLSTWLRDYLYISLGGNRRGAARTRVNLLLTMLLGGLWHGASWNFVVWGGLHGLFLVIERPFLTAQRRGSARRPGPARLAHALATFAGVCVAWTIFRADGLDRAFDMLGTMLLGLQPEQPAALPAADGVLTLATIATILGLHYALRDSDFREVVDRCPWWLRSTLLAAMLAAIAMMPGDDRSFIYFQF
jgi:alginate O-acetyltransferase complex protein AlgI